MVNCLGDDDRTLRVDSKNRVLVINGGGMNHPYCWMLKGQRGIKSVTFGC